MFTVPIKNKKIILALGAESAGNFSIYNPPSPPLLKGVGRIYFSQDFGDLLDNKNYNKYKKSVLNFLSKNNIKPDIILTDLHPLYRTTVLGEELSKKFSSKGGSASGGKTSHIQVQHHIAHIFSAVGEEIVNSELGSGYPEPSSKQFIGIAIDGTGYGLDGKIWGGEIFEIPLSPPLIKGAKGIKRIGHLENQTLIGRELAIREPARILISILSKFLNKNEVYKYVKKYYSKNQFELLYNQLEQNFNCIETSSTGRILDAVSLLLGFSKNERTYKHSPIDALEKNSGKPYNLKPIIKNNILMTTPLFKYLLKNLKKDKKRLAATAQLYIAQGIYGICQKSKIKSQNFLSGGIANNKIISSYLESKGAIANKKIYPAKSKFNGVPRGDAGLSFGQIFYYLLGNKKTP